MPQVEMEGHCQTKHESLEDEGGRKMERSLQDPLPRTGRRHRNVLQTTTVRGTK